MSKSKQIGTAAETAVVRWLQANGYPSAERLALRGRADHGDVRITPTAHAEVKAGKAADNASVMQCWQWLDEAEREGINAGVGLCLLVVKRKGYGAQRVGMWRAFFRVHTIPVETTLDMAIQLVEKR